MFCSRGPMSRRACLHTSCIVLSVQNFKLYIGTDYIFKLIVMLKFVGVLLVLANLVPANIRPRVNNPCWYIILFYYLNIVLLV